MPTKYVLKTDEKIFNWAQNENEQKIQFVLNWGILNDMICILAAEAIVKLQLVKDEGRKKESSWKKRLLEMQATMAVPCNWKVFFDIHIKMLWKYFSIYMTK